MPRLNLRAARAAFVFPGIFCGLLFFLATAAHSDVLTLNNGLQYEGRLGKIAAIGEDPNKPEPTAGEVRVTGIILVDDELRLYFISKNNVPSTPRGRKRTANPYLLGRLGLGVGAQHFWETGDGTAPTCDTTSAAWRQASGASPARCVGTGESRTVCTGC